MRRRSVHGVVIDVCECCGGTVLPDELIKCDTCDRDCCAACVSDRDFTLCGDCDE